MTDDEGTSPDDDESGIELTPGQKEKLRRAMEGFQQAWIPPKVNVPALTLPESFVKNFTAFSGIVEAQQRMLANLEPIFDAQRTWQKQILSVVPKNLDFGSIAQLSKNIDFGGLAQSLGIATKISATFAEQQSSLFKSLGPALEAMRANFYPPNLRAIEGLRFKDVDTVVMEDGIPLYGLPRADTAEALVRAHGPSKRREILGRRWKTISADCRDVLLSCTSETVAPYIAFAVAALDALDAGHTAAAQALAGSLVDTVVSDYFGKDRYKYTPSKRTPTSDAYNEFTVREYVAFAPMWQTYQQFFVSDGDKVPARFSRHATAHAVSSRQFNRRNALQGLMFACSLLYRFDEEAVAIEAGA